MIKYKLVRLDKIMSYHGLKSCIFITCVVMTIVVFELMLSETRSVMKGEPEVWYPSRTVAINVTGIDNIKSNIIRYNKEQIVLNTDKYGPLETDAVVIVIQVHNRIGYLNHTIESLSRVRFISKGLVVFSHDYYDENINRLIQSINFTRVIQIFYPHSIQTHPNEFPGSSPNDCPKNITREMALKIKCTNAEYADRYGHYRDHKLTQLKHHWWWKINTVFNRLAVTRNHDGMFLFIEEDHYVVEDAIHMLRLMETTSDRENKRCQIFSLGAASKMRDYKENTRKVDVTTWISNLGMAFNRKTWNAVEKCADQFCHYDDYNWDWTLQYINQKCIGGMFNTMVARATRIIHIGECGVHHKQEGCDSSELVLKVRQELDQSRSYLYPDSLEIVSTNEVRRNLIKSGGWADPRDHHLCMHLHDTY